MSAEGISTVTENCALSPATPPTATFVANTQFLFQGTGAANTWELGGGIIFVSGAYTYTLPTDFVNARPYRGVPLTFRAVSGSQTYTNGTDSVTISAGEECTWRNTGTAWSLVAQSPGSASNSTRWAPVTTVTEVSNAATLTSNNNKIAGQGDVADDLDTLAGVALVAGNYGVIRPASGTVDITIRDTGAGTGNIRTPGRKPIVLAEVEDWAEWMSDGTNVAITAFRTKADGVVAAFALENDTAGPTSYRRAANAGGTATAARQGGSLVDAAGTGSAGSAAAGTVDAGAGGDVTRSAGAGGASTSTAGAQGGAGGVILDSAGAGGSAAGTDPGGAGGTIGHVGGVGGAKTGTGTANGGAGGGLSRTGGAGGATASTNGSSVGGAGGTIFDQGGAGGAASAGTAAGGAGGACGSIAGTGGTSAGAAGGVGGQFLGQAGTGGAGTTGGRGGNATIIAGPAGAGGNVNGGSVQLRPGSGTGTGVTGCVVIDGSNPNPFLESGATADFTDTAPTLTVAQIRNGQVTGTPTVNRAYTTPSAAQLVAAFPDAVVGSTFDFYMVNLASGATRAMVLTPPGGGGVSIVGMDAVASTLTNLSGGSHFRMRFTNVTPSSETVTFTRVG